MTPDERFWMKVEKGLGCWNWKAALFPGGYGVFRPGGRETNNVGAHVYAYKSLRGPIPTGMDIDHLCRNRKCVNPDHLEVVTRGENLRRGLTHNARNAAKTHCIHGHPFDEENTYRNKGKRYCRACSRHHYRARQLA